MLETAPIWLETMRQLSGVSWAPGDGPNPHIQQWLQFISKNYPANADTTQLLNQMIEVANNVGSTVHQAAASTPDLSAILGTAIAPAVATIANLVLPGGGGALVMLGLGLRRSSSEVE